MSPRSKKYKEAAAKIQGKPFYSLNEAVKLLKETSNVKFDPTAEVHFGLSIDPKKADQNLRGTMTLPHGTGRKVKVAAVVTEEKVKACKEAGAVAAGLDELIEEFNTGKVNYDIIIATPDVMKNLAKVAKTLGQKGLMPNPKSGTVTPDPVKTIKELNQGRIEYRADKEGNVHTLFGKLSFTEEQLEENLKTLVKTIKDAKPASVKGTFVRSITLCSTMGPGIALDVNEALKAVSK
ncbi:50S ribosomal protein L1 [Candidatus Peregrinibacteria bacterium]|nr:50S ribosomal protein L1 [Candidatus Peregrinibacteria bacterium]